MEQSVVFLTYPPALYHQELSYSSNLPFTTFRTKLRGISGSLKYLSENSSLYREVRGEERDMDLKIRLNEIKHYVRLVIIHFCNLGEQNPHPKF